MQNYRGLWLPDGDKEFSHILSSRDGLPHIDGKPTYQHRKYLAAKGHLTGRRHAIDIGAHVGLWTRMLVKDFTFVSCFEPIPAYRECWNLNMEQVTNCVMHPYALGKEHGRVDLQLKESNSGVTHIVPEDRYFPEDRYYGDVSEIGDNIVSAEMLTLDSYKCRVVDFIKIDCEGYERFVIEGAEQTIRTCQPVMVVEQKPSTKDRYGLPFQSAIELLESWGARRGVEIGGDHVIYWPR